MTFLAHIFETFLWLREWIAKQSRHYHENSHFQVLTLAPLSHLQSPAKAGIHYEASGGRVARYWPCISFAAHHEIRPDSGENASWTARRQVLFELGGPGICQRWSVEPALVRC